MDNKKTDQYYIGKIITDLTFIRTHTESLSKSKLEEDEILVDSIMFRLIQVAENSEKLTEKFKETYASIPWRAIKGLRNRIVHEYGNVDLTIVYDTVKKDIPELIGILEGICRCKKNKKFPDSEMRKKTHLRRSGDFLFTVFLDQILYFSISFFGCEEHFIVKRIAKIKKCKKQSGFFDVQVDYPVCI